MNFLIPALLSVVLIAPPPQRSQNRIIDLSHSFDAATVYWPTAEPFKLETDFEGTTEQGFYYSAYRYRAAEHGGTHLRCACALREGKAYRRSDSARTADGVRSVN